MKIRSVATVLGGRSQGHKCQFPTDGYTLPKIISGPSVLLFSWDKGLRKDWFRDCTTRILKLMSLPLTGHFGTKKEGQIVNIIRAGQAKLCLLGLQIGFHSLFRCYYNGLEQSGPCSDRGLAKRFPRISVEPMQEVELADEGSGLALPGHPDENSANLVSLPKSWSFSTSPQGLMRSPSDAPGNITLTA
nr:uncharacterized protein LOC115269258 [Aedes albopictus]